MKERFSHIPIHKEDALPRNAPPKEEVKQPLLSRRDFLVASGAAATLAGLKSIGLPTEVQEQHITAREEGKENEKHLQEKMLELEKKVSKEKAPVILTPLEQLQAYGEIRDMKAGLQIIHDEHYSHLTETEEGLYDMRTAAVNMKRYNIKKLIQPFIEKKLPEELAYMIAIQETRGRNRVSHRGARGMTGIIPATARLLGFKPTSVEDPYLATRATATYFAQERDKRFGEDADVDILLHAYNAGGGLFGFTQATPKEERTSENFYKYMERYINTRFEKIKEKGYQHVLDDEDKTLSHVARRFDMPIEKILKANGLQEDAVIHKGDTLLIPFETSEEAAKIVFRKPMEALRYAPEVKAKYKALKKTGLLSIFNKDHHKEQGSLG